MPAENISEVLRDLFTDEPARRDEVCKLIGSLKISAAPTDGDPYYDWMRTDLQQCPVAAILHRLNDCGTMELAVFCDVGNDCLEEMTSFPIVTRPGFTESVACAVAENEAIAYANAKLEELGWILLEDRHFDR